MIIYKATVDHKGQQFVIRGRSINMFDGYAATKIDLDVSLQSAKDVDDLIEILKCAKPSFHRPKLMK
jgi:hypothetical protein